MCEQLDERASQLTVHLWGFSPVCRRMWTTSMYWALKGFSSREHVSHRHTNDFLLPWIWSVLMCLTSSSWVRNSSPHPLQWQLVSKKTPPSSLASVVSARTVSLLVLLLLLLLVRRLLLFLVFRTSFRWMWLKLLAPKPFCFCRLKSLRRLALWFLRCGLVVDSFAFCIEISSLLALCDSNFIFIFLECCVCDGLSASAEVIVLPSIFLLEFFEPDELSFWCSNCSCEKVSNRDYFWEFKREPTDFTIQIILKTLKSQQSQESCSIHVELSSIKSLQEFLSCSFSGSFRLSLFILESISPSKRHKLLSAVIISYSTYRLERLHRRIDLHKRRHGLMVR